MVFMPKSQKWSWERFASTWTSRLNIIIKLLWLPIGMALRFSDKFHTNTIGNESTPYDLKDHDALLSEVRNILHLTR